MKQKADLDKLLNLGWTRQTNTTSSIGELDLPMLSCHTTVLPEFLALYGEPGRYHEAGDLTGVCFYSYDREFDGIHGLFNAIYHQDEKLLALYRQRFAGVRIFISPDYSQFGDVHTIENAYRLFKTAVVSIWLTNELHGVVIPNITGASGPLTKLLLASLHDCSVVAFSTKGHMNSRAEKEQLRELIRLTVDTLSLQSILVYDTCGDDDQVMRIFEYALAKGINVAIPDNTLKNRNRQRKAVLR